MTADFATLQRRIRIRARLVTQSSLHIGSGGDSLDPTAVDNPVIRLHDGRPFIPGSSLKGVLRAFLAGLLESGGGWLTGSTVSASQCLHAISDAQAVVDGLRREMAGDGKALAEAVRKRLCPVCQLLGSPHFAGRVHVADLLLFTEGNVLERRNGVAIDPDTHTVRSGFLYSLETVAPGAAFGLELRAENPTDEHVHDLFVAVQALAQGEIYLGAKTGSGLGRVRLENVTVADYGPAEVVRSAWETLPALPLEEWARLHGFVGKAPRANADDLARALAAKGTRLTWAEAVQVLREGFGGDGHV